MRKSQFKSKLFYKSVTRLHGGLIYEYDSELKQSLLTHFQKIYSCNRKEIHKLISADVFQITVLIQERKISYTKICSGTNPIQAVQIIIFYPKIPCHAYSHIYTIMAALLLFYDAKLINKILYGFGGKFNNVIKKRNQKKAKQKKLV